MITANATVFVVDDDAAMRDSLGDLIRSVGLRVELFDSAQDFLRSERPDIPGCLVLDVRIRSWKRWEPILFPSWSGWPIGSEASSQSPNSSDQRRIDAALRPH
jgi:hypothetical protein